MSSARPNREQFHGACPVCPVAIGQLSVDHSRAKRGRSKSNPQRAADRVPRRCLPHPMPDRCYGRGVQILDSVHYLVTLGRRPAARLQELDRRSVTQAEIHAIVTDALRFHSNLDFTLRQGLPQERLTALRQRLTRIHVDRPARETKLTIRAVPAGTSTPVIN